MTKREGPIAVIFVWLTFLAGQAFAQEGGRKHILWTADWSSNGQFIAVGGNLDTLKIYQSKDLRLHKSYYIQNTVTCVKWHPFKNIIAIGTQLPSKNVYILDFDTGRMIPLKGISPDGARGIDWNYSGDYLAVADNDGLVSIFDDTGRQVRKIKHENQKSITSIDWHPKKNIFITVGDKIRIHNFNGTLINTIVHRQEGVLLLSVAWHNSGNFFVTGDYGDNQKKYKPLLQFWSAKGDLLKSISPGEGEIRNLSWNTGGNRLASASDALRIWDKKGNLISSGDSRNYLWGVSWNKSGNRIVTSGTEQRIVLWDNNARRIITIE